MSSIHSKNKSRKKTITDARFASLHWEPRFQKVPKRKEKTVIDNRFSGALTDKRFSSSSAPSDKRGKLKKGNSHSALRRYYHLEDEQGQKEKRRKDAVTEDGDASDSVSEKESDSVSEKESESVSEEGSESGSTTEEEEEDADIADEDEGPELQEDNLPRTQKATRRLAVLDLDWRRFKAPDVYVILKSFVPKDGQTIKVSIYPTQFGLERMKEEEIHGPVGLFDDENDDDSDDDEIDIGKLRAYEKSKLSYYLAMVECDSIATAVELYESCDGYEIEMSSNKLDLRFIPDDMEFVHPPQEVADEAPANYEGLDSQTRDMQQTKVNLSWDEDEPQRRKIFKRNFSDKELEELEFKELVASDESGSDDGENQDITNNQSDKKNKLRDSYRSLLRSGDGSDDDGDDEGMVVTFNTGLEDISKRIMEKKGKQSETVWEGYLRKRREKRKANKNKSKYSSEDEGDEADDFFVDQPCLKRSKKEGKQHEDTEKEAVASRAELELLLADDNQGALKGYNLKAKKITKGKKQKQYDDPKIPVVDDDPRFASLFTSPAYALDPTDPQFKRSATYARQIAKRRLKREHQESDAENVKILTDDPGTNKVEHENSDILSSREKQNLSWMVKSVKMKLKQVRSPSNHMVLKKCSRKRPRKIHSKNKAMDLNK